MARWVQMTHPKLPGQEITVAEISVAANERAGWTVVTGDEAATDPAGSSPQDASTAGTGDPPGPDGSTTKEE